MDPQARQFKLRHIRTDLSHRSDRNTSADDRHIVMDVLAVHRFTRYIRTVMIEIEDLPAFDQQMQSGSLENVVIQGLDLRDRTPALQAATLTGAVFLGCKLEPPMVHWAIEHGALVFPRLLGVPYHPYRPTLYSVEDLYAGFDPSTPESYEQTLDARVYAHWRRTGGATPPSIMETLARRLHDHAITDALEELIDGHPVAAIMGGHSMPRGTEAYGNVAWIGRRLAQSGILLATGGGPGAMEATHVGAYFAPYPDDALANALDMLSAAPMYTDDDWLAAAFRVRQRFPPHPDAPTNLGIPTWYYGHEPPNPFATHVAKYFANSVREDGLLTIATSGIIFSPGSAGTIQEIFQDACQNHYVTAGVVSPMVFLGARYWTEDKPVYPLLQHLAHGRPYGELLSITDDREAAAQCILDFVERNDA